MERKALKFIDKWHRNEDGVGRKPLVIRGARQVGKSYLVRDYCARRNLVCLEINFDREPNLARLFVEGPNSQTIVMLEAHFGRHLDSTIVLFLDEIQAAPRVFARLRYFWEDSPDIAVIAAGSLLDFMLQETNFSVPVGRITYFYLGPMSFEEFLEALGEKALLGMLGNLQLDVPSSAIPDVFHERLLGYARDFSLVGGMPEAIFRFIKGRNFLAALSVHASILQTYRDDFGKYRKRIPLERLEQIFAAIPAQIGMKWVYARVNPHQRASALETALDALCLAKVAHRVFHSSGNGVPLAAEKKDNLFKVLFLDVGLLGSQLGQKITDLVDAADLIRINEGAIAEQWIGQHLLSLHSFFHSPELFYWVREKAGAMAELDYLISLGTKVLPVEVKAGSTTRAKSLQVFLAEKKSPLGIHFSINPARHHDEARIWELPIYLVEQLPRLLEQLVK